MYSRHIIGTQYCTVLIYIVDDELFVKYIVAIADDPKLIPYWGIGGGRERCSSTCRLVVAFICVVYFFFGENFMDVLRSNLKCGVWSLKRSRVAVTIL